MDEALHEKELCLHMTNQKLKVRLSQIVSFWIAAIVFRREESYGLVEFKTIA